MEKRLLGRTGIEVAPLAFGGNVFGWTVDEKTSFDLLDQFAEAGFNLIDTADSYSNWVDGNKGGESETIIGNWMQARGNRQKIVIATKVGSSMQRDPKKNLSASYIMRAVDDSLRRLQTDYIDLYQAHYDDPATSPNETLEAFAQLVQQGKIRWIGASNFTPERLQESLRVSNAYAYPRYQTLQPHYNLYYRQEFEESLGTIAVNESLSVLPYYSLASGFLTGKYRSETDLGKSTRGGGMKSYFNPRGFRILDTLDAVAEKHQATPAMIALAWLMNRPGIAAPIASATSKEQLDELVRAASVQLDEQDMESLDNASSYS